MIERPKMGFGVPIGEWLRGPLREWAEDLLDPFAVEKDGWMKGVQIHKKWRERLTDFSNNKYLLWDISCLSLAA